MKLTVDKVEMPRGAGDFIIGKNRIST